MTLRDLRKQNKMTVAEVAKALGVSDRAVGNYEAGRRNMSLESVLKMTSLYDCTAEDIIRAQLNSNIGQAD